MEKERLLTPVLRWFLASMILANVASQMVFTLLAVYLAQLGASVAEVGLVFSVAAIVPFLLQILGGWLSDTIGRLRIIAIGAVAASVGYVLFPLAPSWQWAMLALSLEYISGSFVGPSYSAFVAEQSSEANRGRIFGLIDGIFFSVTVVGPALGGFVSYRWGMRTMMALGALLYVTAAVVRVWMATTTRFRSTTPADRPTLGGLRRSLGAILGLLAAGGLVTWILVTDGAQDVAYSLSWDLLPLYLSRVGDLDNLRIGWLNSLQGAAIIPATLAAGWLINRFGERRLIAAGFLVQCTGLLAFTRSTTTAGFALAAVLLGAGFGMMLPSFDSLLSKAVPEKMRGIAYGLLGTGIGLLSLPAPWLGAQLWERVSPQAPFIVTACVALLCSVAAWSRLGTPARGTREIDAGQSLPSN